MPNSSRATVRSSRFSPSEGGWSGFGPNPYEEERAQRGAQSLSRMEQERRQDERQALEEQRFQEREARLQAHEAKMEEVRHAEFLRKEAEQSAMADRKLAFEKEAAEVMPKILRMDPSSPGAREFLAQTAKDHPNLFISGFAKDGITSQIMAFQKEVDAARKAKGIDDTKTAKETADNAAIAAEVARGGRPTATRIGGTTIKSSEQVAAEKEASDSKLDTKSAANIEKRQTAFDKAHSSYKGALDTLTSGDPVVPGFYAAKNYHRAQMEAEANRLKKLDPSLAPEVDGKMKDIMVAEHNALQSQLGALAGKKLDDKQTKERDELVGELNPLKDKLGYDQIDPKDPAKTIPRVVAPANPFVLGDAPASTPTVASTESAAPANPNLVPSTTPALASTGEGDGLSSTEMVAGSLDSTMDATKPTAVAPPPPATPGVVTPAIPPTGQPDAPDATAEPHPFEGKRKFQKSTGKWGTFVNGQFVPE